MTGEKSDPVSRAFAAAYVALQHDGGLSKEDIAKHIAWLRRIESSTVVVMIAAKSESEAQPDGMPPPPLTMEDLIKKATSWIKGSP